MSEFGRSVDAVQNTLVVSLQSNEVKGNRTLSWLSLLTAGSIRSRDSDWRISGRKDDG
jgi:hypothetical protein